MCSIMGYAGSSIPMDAIIKGFDETISRGPDKTMLTILPDKGMSLPLVTYAIQIASTTRYRFLPFPLSLHPAVH